MILGSYNQVYICAPDVYTLSNPVLLVLRLNAYGTVKTWDWRFTSIR